MKIHKLKPVYHNIVRHTIESLTSLCSDKVIERWASSPSKLGSISTTGSSFTLVSGIMEYSKLII